MKGIGTDSEEASLNTLFKLINGHLKTILIT